MRIEFASGSRKPVTWPDGTLRIGSADGNDVRLDGGGVATRHVRLTRDRRGLVLDVESGAGRVYVNARPVRERALLRAGDTLGIGDCRLRLCADPVPAIDHDADGTNDTATMALRAVAGPLSGRVWPLLGPLELDARGPVELPRGQAMVLVADGHVALLDVAAADDAVTVRVNGVDVRRAHLGDGDQIAFGPHRFVLDVSARVEPVHPPPAHADTEPEPTSASRRAPHREMGWLIVTAALLALVLAWVLLVHY